MCPQFIDEVRSTSSLDASAFASAGTVPIGFYTKWGKRAVDLFSSCVGLVVLSPVFGVVACCIKLSSSGPLFYRQARVGKDGQQFQILKFRSMSVGGSRSGLAITVSGDRRVTPVGRVLRHYKLDELPQLWNVLRGDMSLVGPRPELPFYVAAYTAEQRQVLAVRPGITDPSSLVYRHEEEILADHRDPERFYRTQLLPDKLTRSLCYIQTISLKSDLYIIFETMASLLLPSRKAK